jgi:Mg2+-importing ATPase
MTDELHRFWGISHQEALKHLRSSPHGLTSEAAKRHLKKYGPNLFVSKRKRNVLTLFLHQFSSPIILILFFATGLSFFVRDATNALIILSIIFISGLLGFWQEKGASDAVEKLVSMVKVRASALRDGKEKEIWVEDVVPGDVIELNAGDIVPADCLLLESKDLFVNEAALTGESYPVEKEIGVIDASSPLSKISNSVFMGTYVVSGDAKALAVLTAKNTEIGKISQTLQQRFPETEFERGVRRFGNLLMQVTLLLVIAIFAINVYFARPVLEAFLFSLALAVGLTPQLLPAIIGINLSHGAKRMAAHQVIVKKLASIENFGSMNVLCADKTGTLTEGVVKLYSAIDIDGKTSEKSFLYGYINAYYETGFTNPMDDAIRNFKKYDLTGYKKLDEVPYDFGRKLLSILVARDGKNMMVTKGTLKNVIAASSSAEGPDGKIIDINAVEAKILGHYEELSKKGFRVLGLAYGDAGHHAHITRDNEKDLIFLGLLIFFDPLKAGIIEMIKHLSELGIGLKIVTGDNRYVTAYVVGEIGLTESKILTGGEIRGMDSEALARVVNEINIFAEIEPREKEEIVLALKKSGNIVGALGDGINDATALRAADIGISVESAVDIAKEAADIVLLKKDLGVLVNGVLEGRRTFANTLKYVFMATSANFGNMFSMAGVSLFLSFLPLLPKQILLTNLLTDFPEMTIATDNVEKDVVMQPRRWDIKFIRRFMLVFGLLSSIFDFLTFGVLIFLMHASVAQFRTGWFMESVLSASLVVLVIRTRKPIYLSRPGKYLILSTVLIAAATLILPYTLIGRLFNFTPLELQFLVVLFVILISYFVSAEFAKKLFYSKVK